MARISPLTRYRGSSPKGRAFRRVHLQGYGLCPVHCNTNAKFAIKLKNYNYSSAGAYFVTICIRDRINILSEIVKTDLTATDKTNGLAVGEGLAPPEITTDKTNELAVGEGLAPPEITVKLNP